MLLELTVRLVHLPPQQVDSAIEGTLRSVCEFMGIHRSGIYQGMPDITGNWRLTHLYQHPAHATVVRSPAEGIKPRGGWTLLEPDLPPAMTLDAKTMFPWVTAKVARDEVVVVNSLDEIPSEGAKDRMNYAQVGSMSVLVFPLVEGDRVFGGMPFTMVGEERTWEKEVIENLRLVAQIFAQAIARKGAERALRRSEERLRLTTAAAGAALWTIENGSGRMWFNDIAREMFGPAAEEELVWERWLAAVHPDDRARVDKVYRASVSGKDVKVDFRFERPDGSLRWATARGRQQFDPDGMPAFLVGVTLDITERKASEEKLEGQLEEIRRLKERLDAEVIVLRDEVQASRPSGEIAGASDAIRYVHFRIGKVAPLDTTVLIQGETGTGKNLAASAIHAQSRRKDRPLITVSCTALPGNLIESELFGRERGAFTGADQKRLGRFEIADGSSLFLDEIGDMPLDLQTKLLRVVQTGEFERLGSSKTLKVDVRIIAATNRNLEEAVREGRFRADLFYRLNVFPITMPSLREHREDIPVLVRTLVEKFARKCGRSITTIPEPLLTVLMEYAWPGNVRELENVIERAVIVSAGPTLKLAEPLQGHTPAGASPSPLPAQGPGAKLEEVEREHISRTLQATGWRIQGKGGAAERLGLNSSTLRARMRKLGIRREEGRA
jgi:PAS domain S-box-containing protein